MPEVSVVIPTRDVREYVAALISDLRQQTFSDFEAILVDDGSTDGTPEVVATAIDGDPRFRQLSTGGDGVSSARNLGVAHAGGEFLAFVDADDRVSTAYLRALRSSAVETGADLVSCNAHRLDGYRTSPSALHRRACAEPQQRTHLARLPHLVWDTTVWNKLWRRSMWDSAGIRYSEGRWLNDFYPCFQAHVASRHVDVLGEVLYYWRVRTDPTTSITDRRLTDPDARRKSFADRMHAMLAARTLLAAKLPVQTVLDAFDYRILHHDLPIYLPYYVDAEAEYQQLLISSVQDLLSRFSIRPERFPFGVLLQSAYRAIRAGDRDRLATLLDPATRVTASATRRNRTELVLAGADPDRHRPQTTAHGPGRWLLRRLRPGRTEPDRVTAMAELTGAEIDTPAPNHITIHGAVRIREGRSDVAGSWTAAARLDGLPPPVRRLDKLPQERPARLGQQGLRLLRVLSLTTRITGDRTPIGPQPDAALHPLVRSGWHPFTTTLDLTGINTHPRVAAWTLGVELRAGGLTVYARTTLANRVVQMLPPGVQVAPDADAQLDVDRTRQLRLHRRPARVRARAAAGGTLGLALPVPGAMHVWLQRDDGSERTTPVPAGPETRLPLPAELPAGPAVFELWCRAPDGPVRVRADRQLRTTPVVVPGVPDDDHTETVLRPSEQGHVLLEVRPRRLDLGWAEAAETGDKVLLGGAGDPSRTGTKRLQLRCRWTGERETFPVEPHAGGWQAAVPLAALLSDVSSRNRTWNISMVDGAGELRPVRVPAELRPEFPVAVPLATETVHLFLLDDAGPALSLCPDDGGEKWPQLRRVQRSRLGPEPPTRHSPLL